MITPRTTTCTECTDVDVLISDIDCQIAKLSGKLYNNIRFLLNRPFSAEAISKLLHYKRILQYKKIDATYLEYYTIEKIAGRIKILKYK